MDFSGQIILVYLEEDNVQRSYFRIRPLLMRSGPASAQDIAALPDDGFLRIVPDKNEQHTFKERMRELGILCLLNLKDIPPDASKIRSNKNYSPALGETNQFIVYSDAVQPLSPSLVYEVVPVDEGDSSRIHTAATPMAYTRSGGRIHGPYSRATGLPQANAAPLPPDSEGLHAVTLPGGQEKLFYWPQCVNGKADAAPVKPPARFEAIVLDNAGVLGAEPADIVETEQPALPPQPAVKLAGTPLYQSVAKRVIPATPHNPLSEVVEQQVRINKAEAPGMALPANTTLREVENPMDTLKRALNTLWLVPDMQKQAVAAVMGMTGVQPLLSQALAGRGSDAVIAAMQSQLQDLEAERLTALVQLDEVKKNQGAMRRDALETASREETAELGKLKKDADTARAAVDRLEGARADLLRERDEVLALIQKTERGASRRTRLAPPLGGECDLSALCGRVTACLRACGFVCAWDDALNLLLLYALSPQTQLCAPTACDALSAAEAFAKALGAAFACLAPGADAVVYEGGDAPAIAAIPEGIAAAAYSRFIIGAGPAPLPAGSAAYALMPWPVARVRATDTGIYENIPAFAPVKASCVTKAVLDGKTPLSKPVVFLLGSLCKALETEGKPLPQSVRHMMQQYVSAASSHMEGGIATAMDYAVCAWVLPHVACYGLKGDGVRALIGGLARATEWMDM
jgi:hypothetical protein